MHATYTQATLCARGASISRIAIRRRLEVFCGVCGGMDYMGFIGFFAMFLPLT
jgi:hypothetical protein